MNLITWFGLLSIPNYSDSYQIAIHEKDSYIVWLNWLLNKKLNKNCEMQGKKNEKTKRVAKIWIKVYE